MITGVRLSELAVGEPLLTVNWEYKNLKGKEAVIERLKDQFYYASYIGFTYIIDTIRPQQTSSGRLTVDTSGINGDIWTFDERMQKYYELSKDVNNPLTIVLEIEFTVQVTENNVDEYIRFILSNLVAKYQWVKRWIIGVNPDHKYADGTYNCAPKLYVYMMNELYHQIKLFDHDIQIGGPNIYESITEFLNKREGWLAESTGEFYSKSSDYLDIGPHGFLPSIDFFTFQGKQNTSYYQYSEYASIVSNIRALIYDHLGDNILTLFSTSQGRPAITTDDQQQQAYYDMREILKCIQCGVVPFKNELVDAYNNVNAWQGHYDASRQSYGILNYNMVSKLAYSTYKFIFEATQDYITLHNVSNVYENNDHVESITFQRISEGTIYNLTIIWSATYSATTVSLLSASFKREYQVSNNIRTLLVDNTDISLLPGQFLIVFDEVEVLTIDKDDIRLNIERRLRYQREINDQMVAELPSSFNKEVTDTNFYKILRAVSVELADASMILTMMKEDLYLDTAREDAIYENFGTLVKLQKKNDWTYEKYKKLVRGVMVSLLKGPTTQSVIDALSLFTNFKVSIAECYQDSTKIKYADIMPGINPQFSFIIELEKPLDDDSMTQDELMEDTAYVLQLVKPAHTIGILIIILSGSERWDTYYNSRYAIDWHDMDEGNIAVDLDNGFNEGTFGWRHISYPGNFHISDGLLSNSSLLNNGALLGPRYVLADHAYIDIDNTNKELFDLSLEVQEYIYTFLNENISIDVYNTPNEYTENLVDNVEARFGYNGSKYLRLSGAQARTTLNNYLLAGKSSLKDELLAESEHFFADKYMFSNLLKVIRFSNNYGISAKFASRIDVVTHWYEYLNEHSYREKIISLSNGTTQVVQRINEILSSIDLDGIGLRETSNTIDISELYTNNITLYEDLHIPDDPLGSFRLNYPRDINLGFNNHKLGPNKREKYSITELLKDTYNTANDYLSVIFGFELAEKYTNEIKETITEITYDPHFIDTYDIYKELIQFSIPEDLKTYRKSIINAFGLFAARTFNTKLTNTEYNIPTRTTDLYQGDIITGNDFADEFEEFLSNADIKDILQQIFINDTHPITIDYDDPQNISNLILKLNLLREHPLLQDKLPQLDKWIATIHGTLQTPAIGKPYLRRVFIKHTVEKYTIGCGLKEEYFAKNDTNNISYSNKPIDAYTFDINDEENDKNVIFTDNIQVLDFPNNTLQLNNLASSMFSISKTIIAELTVDNLTDVYTFLKKDAHNIHVTALPKDTYDFNIDELENHRKVITTENIPVLDYASYPVQFNVINKSNKNRFNRFAFTENKTVLTEWTNAYIEHDFNTIIEKNISTLYQNNADINTRTWYNYELPRTVTWLEHYIIDRNDKQGFNFNQGRFNRYKFIKPRQEALQFATQCNELKMPWPQDILIPIKDEYDSYLYPICDNFTLFNTFSENYSIYDEDKDLIRLNQSTGRFISRRSNLIAFMPYYKDIYNKKVNEFIELLTNINTQEQFNKPDELATNATYNADEFTLYDDENAAIRLNKSTGKFVKYKTAIYSLHNLVYDDYHTQVYESITFTSELANEEQYNKPNELVIHAAYNTDKFTLYDDENEAIRLNKSTGKFIKHKAAIYSLNPFVDDKYELAIYESVSTSIDSLIKEQFNKPDELVTNITYSTDEFTLYDDENAAIRLNTSTGKFVKYKTAIYSLHNLVYDDYCIPVYESIIFTNELANEEQFNKPNELVIHATYNVDEFTLYDDENEAIRLNTSTGKFIKHKTAIYSLNPFVNDKYELAICESVSTKIDSLIKEQFNKPDELVTNTTYNADEFTLYDEENEAIRVSKGLKNHNNFTVNGLSTHEVSTNNASTYIPILGKFIRRYTNKINTLLSWQDYYEKAIYESAVFDTNNFYQDIFNNIKDNSLFTETFNEQFILYDDEHPNTLQLNKTHLLDSKFIRYRTAWFSLQYILSQQYDLPILEQYHFYTNQFEKEYYNKVTESYEYTNNFHEQYIPYDEDKGLKLNSKLINRNFLISTLGSRIQFYTYYFDLFNKPADILFTTINTTAIDKYTFKIDESANFSNIFNDRYIPYDEDKGLKSNRTLLNRSFLLGKYGSVLSWYTYNNEQFYKPIDTLTLLSDNVYADMYNYQINDYNYPDKYTYFSETIDIKHINLRFNKTTLNQSVLIGQDWEKIYPYLFYNEFYSKVVTDKLLMTICKEFHDLYSACDDIYSAHYFDLNKDRFDAKYLQKDLNTSNIIRDYSLQHFYNVNIDFYTFPIFNKVLNSIDRLHREDILLQDVIDESPPYILYEDFDSDKFIPKQDESLTNIIIPYNKDKFNPIYGYNKQHIKLSKDDKYKEVEEKFNVERTDKEQYHNLNSIRPFQLNINTMNQGTFINKNEYVTSEVTIADKYHPTLIEIEQQRLITLSEKMKKPRAALLIETDINVEIINLQPNKKSFRFNTSMFTNNQFLERGIIDIADFTKQLQEMINRPAESQLTISKYLFTEQAKLINDRLTSQSTYFVTDKYISKLKDHNNYLENDVRLKDNYQVKSAVAYIKLEKALHGRYITVRRGTYV